MRVSPGILVAAVVLAATACTGEITGGGPDEDTSPEASPRFLRSANPIPGRYIVVLTSEPGLQTVAIDLVRSELEIAYPLAVSGELKNALRGFVVEMDEPDAIALSEDARVAYVEEDGVVQAGASQANATFGLDRIDERSLPLDGGYTFANDGAGVHAYVIDSGIRASHADFEGRVGEGKDFVGDGQGTNDCNGHGTHVAGTIGSETFGVAKGVTLHALRTLNCAGQGSVSDVVEALDFVTANAIKPAVVNMSIGSGPSDAQDQAVRNAVAAGITVVAAAGNDTADACGSSPGRTGEAITVAASNRSDARASFSNFGGCVDLFAPGTAITSLSHQSDSGTLGQSGTSMASPHVAGVAALVLAANRGASPADVAGALIGNASTEKLSDTRGAPNRLLNTSFIGPAQP